MHFPHLLLNVGFRELSREAQQTSACLALFIAKVSVGVSFTAENDC